MKDREAVIRNLILEAIAQRVQTHAGERRHWQRVTLTLQAQEIPKAPSQVNAAQ